LKKSNDFPIGSWVKHITHGHGTVIAHGDSNDEVIVRFDIKPEDWDQELCVSAGCLSLVGNEYDDYRQRFRDFLDYVIDVERFKHYEVCMTYSKDSEEYKQSDKMLEMYNEILTRGEIYFSGRYSIV